MAGGRASENECAAPRRKRRRKVQIFARYFSTARIYAYLTGSVGRSVLINTLALYPPLGRMVETKDSAALFLPSTEALSHGRLARRIGRVRSHKRSLRNQFHLFVNTREDFHSPGGIPPQDHVVALALSPFHYFSTGTRIAIVARQKVPRRPESPIRSALPRSSPLLLSCFFLSLSPLVSRLFCLKTIAVSPNSRA